MNQGEKKKKILFISDLTFAYTMWGTEVASARLANGLARNWEYEIYCFTSALNGRKPWVEPDPSIKIFRFPLFPFIGDKDFNIFTLPSPFRIRKLIKKILPDCIHVHTPSLSGYFSVTMAKQLGIRSVYTNHIFAEHFVPKVENRFDAFKKTTVDHILAWYMWKFDAIVYPSKIQMDSVHLKYKLKNQATVISNGFTPLEINIPLEKPSHLQWKTVFLSVSRLSVEKNIHMLIEAFERVHAANPNSALLVVGGGNAQKELEQLASSKKASEAIYIVGEKRGNELANHYLWWDVFVSASSREAEPVTVLEAVGFSKPLILSDAPGNGGRQFIEENGLLFQDGDIQDLSQKMEQFIKDPSLLRIGENGKEILKKYNFQEVLKKFSLLYFGNNS